MADFQATGPYRASRTPGGSVVLVAGEAAAAVTQVIVAGHAGDAIPAVVVDPGLQEVGDAGRWRLTCRDGTFDFRARGVEVHQPLPGFFDEALATHALGNRDRVVVRWLLGLLKLPGGARLLRAWHARRRG